MVGVRHLYTIHQPITLRGCCRSVLRMLHSIARGTLASLIDRLIVAEKGSQTPGAGEADAAAEPGLSENTAGAQQPTIGAHHTRIVHALLSIALIAFSPASSSIKPPTERHTPCRGVGPPRGLSGRRAAGGRCGRFQHPHPPWRCWPRPPG